MKKFKININKSLKKEIERRKQKALKKRELEMGLFNLFNFIELELRDVSELVGPIKLIQKGKYSLWLDSNGKFVEIRPKQWWCY